MARQSKAENRKSSTGSDQRERRFHAARGSANPDPTPERWQGSALKSQLEEQARAAEEENQKRLAERSEVEKEQRKTIDGARAIAAGSSEAFQIQTRIYDRGGAFATEKRIEKSTEKIEKYVAQMQEQLYQYLSGNSPLTISMGY